MNRVEQPQGDSKAFEGRIPLLGWATLFAAASVLFTGYQVYCANQDLQLPLVRLINDPSLFPHDPFAATLPYYASFVWRIVAWCTRIAPMESVLLAFFLASRVLTMYAAGNLAQALAPKSRLAMAAAMAFIATKPVPLIGDGTILASYFEHTSLAVGFFLMAMAAFHRRRPVAWAMWLTAGFYCNSLYGGYALTYFGAAFLIDPDHRKEWKSWLGSLTLFAALSIPVIRLSAAAFGKGAGNSDLWIAACRARIPHHLFPSTWPGIDFVRFDLFILVMAGAALLRGRGTRVRDQVFAWMTISLGWLMVTIAAEWLRSPPILVLQPARATDLWYCFGAISLMAMSLSSPDASLPRLRGVGGIGTVLALMPFLLFHPVSLAGLGLAVLLVASIGFLPKRRARPSSIQEPFREGDSALRPRAGISGGRVLTNNRLAAAVAVLILMIGLRALGERVLETGHLSTALAKAPSSSLRLVCDWARTSTPKDATFLVNPNWGMFRALSARPAFVTWKDGSALMWYRPFAAPWSERMKALGYDVSTGRLPGVRLNSRLDRLYGALTDFDALRLAERYHVDYWIVGADRGSALPVVYANSSFKVLRTLMAQR